MRKAVRAFVVLGVIAAATPHIVTAQVVDPNSLAAHFTPALPNLAVAVWCTSNFSAYPIPYCNEGGVLSGFPDLDGHASIDANGWLYPEIHEQTIIGTCTVAGMTSPIKEFRIRRISPGHEVQVIGYLRDVCEPGVRYQQLNWPNTWPAKIANWMPMQLDPYTGTLYLRIESGGSGMPNPAPQIILRITGFPSLLDVILSYQPPSTLSFNVPVRPEGLPGADSFSVYTGDVLHASDLSQAAPLQCTVPSGRPPVAGEQLSVADLLPDPAEGGARYYLAAVNYQGQRRAGRSAINGVLQGRNAAALPGCP